MKTFILPIFLALTAVLSTHAQDNTSNARQARRIMETAYNRVFGSEGSSFSYDVNIVGIYKTHGAIIMKGKRQRFADDRADVWNDGKTIYKAYRRKHIVEILDPHSPKANKHKDKFKFSLDDFTYSMAKHPEGILLTLKQRKGAKGTVKEVQALVASQGYAPIRLRVKVAFFWTTIHISRFKSGGISDDIFLFPREKYKGWKFSDKR